MNNPEGVPYLSCILWQKKVIIFNVHIQVWFHLCPNWKYGLHQHLCLPLGHRSYWFLGWNGKECCQVSEIKYFLCRFVSKTKEEGKRQDFLQIQQAKWPPASVEKLFKGGLQTLQGAQYRVITPIRTKEHSWTQAKLKLKQHLSFPDNQGKKENKIGVTLLFAS